MRKIEVIGVLLIITVLFGCKQPLEVVEKSEAVTEKEEIGKAVDMNEMKEPETGEKMAQGTYAVMTVSHGEEILGDIIIRLYPDKTPVTVQNFIDLAQGNKEFVDPRSGQKVKRAFYDGLIFHRVISKFMIQGGDPMGTGRGGPGYKFQDEIVPGLMFDKPGKLAMANAGPNTNGSQFFITVVPTPWLNGRHTIFGEVIEGQDIVQKISEVPTIPGDRPEKTVMLKKVVIKAVK